MAKKKHRSRRHKSLGKRIGNAFNALTEGIESFFKSMFRDVGKVGSFLGDLLIPKTITKRFSRATKSTGKSVGKRVGAITETVEKKFSKGASGILSSLGYVAKIFLPKPLVDWFSKRSKAISRWFSNVLRRIGKWLGSLAERYLPKWLFLALKRFSASMRRARRTTSKFNTAWWKSRNYHSLAWSTPAFMLSLPMLMGLTFAAIYRPPAKIAHYQSVMFTALEDKEFEKAELFRAKLSQLGYAKMERFEFSNAIALAANNKIDEAYEQMRKIAALPGQGGPPPISPDPDNGEDAAAAPVSFAPAHQWIAAALLRDEIKSVPKEERIELAKKHIDIANELEPKSLYARYLFVRHRVLTDQIDDQAIDVMDDLASEYPELNGELLQYYLASGEAVRARTSAKRFARHAKSTKRDQLEAVDYYFWVLALETTGELEEAATVAREGGRRFRNDERVANSAKRVVLARLAQADQDAPETTQLLREAHELDPSNGMVIARLARRWVYEPLEVDPIIQEMKAARSVSAPFFLRAGELHSGGGRNEEAIRCFEQALEVDSNCAAAHNNLAWIRSNIPPLRLRDALASVSKAIELEPRALFFETRGQIHFQMEEFELAASDLERAINGGLPIDDELNSHETLAKIHKRLGNLERAAAHESRAKRLELRSQS